jgi:tape measure domain-containing protein
MMQAKLKLATGSMEQAKSVQADLFNMAQRLRAPLEDSAKLYTRMAIPMQRMGKDAKETAEQVEFVSLALKLNGATAGEASSVMLQYSQSVNAGRLNGAEFNAVAEGAPGILRAIEAELKATGKWSEHSGKTLKQMGADGEITFELMNRASQRALPQMRKDFEQLPLTVDGAIQRVKNAWFKAMGELGEETGLGTKLASAIAILEQSIPKIRDAMVGVFLFLHENFGKIAIVVEAILAMKLVTWLGGVTTAMYASAAAATASATGIVAAESAIVAFGRGMALLAGPVGIIIALIGVGLVQAYRAFSDMAPKAEAAVTNSTAKNTASRIEMIQNEINKLNERNGIAAKGIPKPEDKNLPQTALEQLGRVNSFRKRQAAATTDAERSFLGIDIAHEQAQFEKLVAMEEKLKAVRAKEDERIKGEKARGWESKFGLKTENKAEEFARKLAEAKKEAAELGIEWKSVYETRLKFDIMGKNGGAPAPDKVDHFAKLKAEVLATSDALRENITLGEKATASEKLKFKLNRGGDVDYNKMNATDKARVMAVVDANIADEARLVVMKKLKDEQTALAAERDKYTSTLTSGNASLDDYLIRTDLQIAALTMTKGAVKDLAAAELERESAKAIAQASFVSKDTDLEQYNLLVGKAEKLQLLADKTRELGKGQDEKLAYEELDRLLDPKKAMNFGDALGEAFGKAGEAIGKMSKALGVYGKAQEKIDDTRASFMSIKDEKVRNAGLAALDKQEAQSKLRAYGDMAAGAKDLFSEHTAGYKLMATTEKAFRLAEMAMTIESTALKVWGSLTAAGAKGVETTAVVTGASVDAAATGGAIASSMARTGAYVMEGAAKMYAWLGPWGTVAVGAMLAVMASVGFGGGGSAGGSVVSAEDRQKRQGTGTILGDDTAKSSSLTKAMDGLKDNSNIGLVHSSNMLAALRSIEASMQGLASAIFKVSGMTTGKNFGIQEGAAGGGFLSSVFGGKTNTTITDTGLALNGTAGQFRNGSGVSQYVDVNHQKSGGWFSKDKNWNTRDYMAADSEITKTIGRTFSEINSTISEAAVALGGNGAAIGAALDAYVVNTEVSFKGLVGDELQQALNNVFSAAADGMARSVYPGLEAFQAASEGYYQTVIRVSTGTEQARNALKGFSITMVDANSLINKTGDIATELVRQSIMAKESGTALAGVMRVMDGSMADMVEGYKALLNIQDAMRSSGVGSNISMALIRGAGGIAELQGFMEDFTDGFYSDAQKQAMALSKVRLEFGRIGAEMPKSKEGFKALVTSLMAGGEASQELAGRVLGLAGSFADAFSVFDEAVTDARSVLEDAYGTESDALQEVIDKMKGFTDSLKSFKDNLIMGDLSTKSSYEKYATSRVNYETTSALAMTGDQTAIGNFEKVASEMLKYSRELNASGVAYTADYDRVLLETEALRLYTATQVDVATASLSALKDQVKGLIDINTSVISVADAIVALHLAMLAANPLMKIDGSHAGGLSNVPFNGYIAELHKGEAVLTASENSEYKANLGNVSVRTDAAMVNELKALREELKQLREEQREQTSNMIVAGYDSNERNAQAVVNGTRGAMEDASYLERTKTGLV